MPENDLVERLARALKPGPVEPPPRRVRALRNLVGTRAAAGAGEPDRGEPSRGNGTAHAVADDGAHRQAASAIARSAPYWPVVEPPPADHPAPGATVSPLARARSRRGIPAAVPRALSSVLAVAAVAILVAMVAAQDLPAPLREVARGVGLPVDSTQLVAARRDIDELALALARQDAPKVAEADAAMLKSTSRLEGDDLQQLRPLAVKLHVEALAFLRDSPRPEALSDLLSPEGPGGTAQTPDGARPGGQPQPDKSAAPAGQPSLPGGSVPASPALPATPPELQTVTIRDISPRLNATFEVDFTVSGFNLGAGQPYAVQFSFDSGREPTTYYGPSPWRFPLLSALRYRRLCAQVVDAAGVADPTSGNCLDILLL